MVKSINRVLYLALLKANSDRVEFDLVSVLA